MFDACWSPRRSAGARRATLPPPDPPTGSHLSAQRPKSVPNLSKSLILHVHRDAPRNTEILVLTPPSSRLSLSSPTLSLSLSPPSPLSPFTHPAAGAGWLASWLAGWAAGPPSEPMKTSRSTRAWSSGPRKPPPRAESPPLFASSLSLHLFPLPPFLLLAPTILYLSCVPASPLYALAAPR